MLYVNIPAFFPGFPIPYWFYLFLLKRPQGSLLHKALNITLYFLITAHIWEAGLLFWVSACFWSFHLPFAVVAVEGSKLTPMAWSHSTGARQAEQGGGSSTSHQWASDHQAKYKVTRAPRWNQEIQTIQLLPQKQAQLQHSSNHYWRSSLELKWSPWFHS